MQQSKLFAEIAKLRTEKQNQNTRNIDILPTDRILELINNEDKLVANAVEKEITQISKAVDIIVDKFKLGGRLIYVGAGTSGRLGIVDASECPPTFGSDPEMVQGIIAGGPDAVFLSQEGAEDSREEGAKEILNKKVNDKDCVCGIAASGRTPFVLGAVNKAKELGAATLFISTANKDSIESCNIAYDVLINPNVGAETIMGSTRMKSGTAQKLILNMLTTASMVKLGKTYSNIMVDLQLKNNKLKERAKRILMMTTGVNYKEADEYLIQSKGHVKTAIVMILAEVDFDKAKEMLTENDGIIRKALINYNIKI